MISPWQRHLLMLSEEAGRQAENHGAWLAPETAVVAVAVLVAMVMLLLLCVCGDKGSEKDSARKNGSARVNGTAVADPAALTVVTESGGETNHVSATAGEVSPVINGVANGARSSASPSSHSRQESSGSNQMRPTSLRELPDLPVNSHSNHKRNHSGAGVADKSANGRNGGDQANSNDAYDHLGVKIGANKTAALNYDHIKLETPHDLPSEGTTPASEPDTASEGHYAQVRERTYDVVKDVRSRASAAASAAPDYDPYAKVKDEEDEDKEDPYSRVRDSEKEDADDDYAHLKHDHVTPTPSANFTTITTVEDEEDPYEKVIGDSGGARVVIQASSNNLDPDDLYSEVGDQPQVKVIPLNSGGNSPPRMSLHPGGDNRGAGGGGANTNNSAAGSLHSEESLRLQYADEETDSQDDYATVVKDRNPSTGQEEGGAEGEGGRGEEEEEEIEPYFTTPPEPPRMYGASEVGTLLGAVGGATGEDASRHNTKEHRYTKVTARESLASMTARNALNTYEIVPDLPENTYATVEGGSGDGVVRYATPGTPNLQHSNSQVSDTYTEIGASGGYANPAPEPPSLDSLHSMTKSTSSNDADHTTTNNNHNNNNSRIPTSPSSNHPNVIIADDGYAVVSKTAEQNSSHPKASGFSPSETALPQIPQASGSMGSVGSLGEEMTINGVTLHTDYHSVKDCIPPDQDSENDPNYESVDEALSKFPPPSSSVGAQGGTMSATPPCVTIINHVSPSRRDHQYEEVSPPSSPPPASGSTPRVTALGASSSSNGASSNGVSSSGVVPRQGEIDPEAAEVRDRVLQGHMYEAISDVKTRQKNSSVRKTGGEKTDDSTKL